MFKWLGGLVDSNEKVIKRLYPVVDEINSLEPQFEKLSDAELKARTEDFKARYKAGASLDDLLPEAFAAVREAARRTIGQRHFDVQLMGGVVLHQGKIAEMKTGEGKTLVATLPLYLNSLTGKGCHLVTVNDYLARRDPYWMGPIYHALGISVAGIYPQQAPDEHTPSRIYDPAHDSGDPRWRHFRTVSRKEAYDADITYGTSAEFGFDYLRDNMVIDLKQCVQRPQSYAIVDEVDNLLIDEARTPLIISGPAAEPEQTYHVFARIVPRLQAEADYVIDEKTRTVNLTDDGIGKVEGILRREGVLKTQSLYDPANYSLAHYLDNAMKAQVIFRRDRDYVVKDGQVIIVDEFTGRLMLGRRYSEGLHQAIEAKERVKVQQETMTYATVTIQNYFRMYQKLAGMTGTAVTEAEEFHKIYKLEVVVIPTNKPMTREDYPDQIYKDEETKFRAVAREVEKLNKEGRPVLLGTVSIEKSELISDTFMKKGIPHQVLNAKLHEKEASIIAQAGKVGSVTIATNMAGRGVDIILGGNPEGRDEKEWRQEHEKVIGLGGLHVIGTERHEARRIDNQLRGRSGRQGDPGSTRFFVSLADDIMRRFGGERIKGLMEWAGMDEETPIENKLISRSIESAQVRVEGYHFDMRKHLVEYDDVVNKHRELIYTERRKILSGSDLKANILPMIREEIKSAVAAQSGDKYGEGRNTGALLAEAATLFPIPAGLTAETLSQMEMSEIEAKLIEQAEAAYEQKEKEIGADNMRMVERLVMLRTVDNHWIEHLTAMENMRQGIGLQAVAQRDPLVAYKREGHALFQALLENIQRSVTRTIYHVAITRQEEKKQPEPSPMARVTQGIGRQPQRQPAKVGSQKVGRNDPCPCGSGKKYKHCHGK